MVKPPQTSWFLKRWICIFIFLKILMLLAKEKCTPFPGHMINNMVSIKYIYELAKIKKEMDPHLKTSSLESICRSIMGQCSSMGILVVFDQEKPEKPIKINMKL